MAWLSLGQILLAVQSCWKHTYLLTVSKRPQHCLCTLLRDLYVSVKRHSEQSDIQDTGCEGVVQVLVGHGEKG